MVRLPLLLLFLLILSHSNSDVVCGQTVGNVLLMKNGAVLPNQPKPSLGGIERRGDFYVVKIAEQSSASIPVEQVQYVGQDLESIYSFKVSSVKRWAVGDHYQMTQWCILHGLLDHASEHYQEVSRRAGDHPRVKQLAMQLEQRLLEEPDFRAYLGLAAIPERAVESPPATKVQSDTVASASSHAFDAAMHPEIAARFSQKIQPILMNRCSQSACHGVHSQNGLRLMEPYGQAYSRISSENLRSVLGQVGTGSGELPALLQFATNAHGIQRSAAISLTETHLLTELKNWIEFVHNPVVAAVATETAMGESIQRAQSQRFLPFSPAVRLIPVAPGETSLRQVPRGGEDLSGAAFPAGESPSISEIDALDRQLQMILGETPPQIAPSNGTVPQDPFDPEAFNRQNSAAAHSQTRPHPSSR